MHVPEPQTEHKWLQRLVGDWTCEHECSMGPDEPPMKTSGTESVRSIGGLWTVGEGQGEMPTGGSATMIMTLGYDPQTGRFVGTFFGSMMTHLWVYNGTLDAAGKVLTLDTVGPDFSGGDGMIPYQDLIEFVDDNHRVLSSRFRGPDGKWIPFTTSHYHRKK